MAKIKRRKASDFEERYGGTHGVLDVLMCCGFYEPTAQLEKDVQEYIESDPRMRKMMEQWLQDNAREFRERAQRKAAKENLGVKL